jgi:hypothetical protein
VDDTTPTDRIDDGTPTAPLPHDTRIVLPSQPARSGRMALARDRVRMTATSVRRHSRTFRLAVVVAITIGVMTSVIIGLVPFAFSDRGLWDAEVRFLIGYWYLVAGVVLAFVPVTFTALRGGTRDASDLIGARGYWKALLAACVVVPAAVAVIVFVASHLLAVVLTIVVILLVFLLLALTVGF